LTMDDLTMLLIEIEGTLNTRPLTYQEEHWSDQPVLRPIDFIQRDMIITYPMEGLQISDDDPNYHPSEEMLQLRTRRQTEEALRSSYYFTERFWNIWSEQYLTALREQHTGYLCNNHGTPKVPTTGTVVLIMNPNLPRNTWKMGRITKVNANKEGVIREEQQQEPIDASQDLPPGASTRYDLRRRPRVDYGQLHHGTLLSVVCLLALTNSVFAQTAEHERNISTPTSRGNLRCTPEGVRIFATKIAKYELCSEGFCVVREKPPTEETLRFPPEITFQEHQVQWKTFDGEEVTTTETRCPAVPFCSQVDCWFCTANIFNPECRPRAAIIALAVIIYAITALLYTLCYIPVVIGRPCRVLLTVCFHFLRVVWAIVKYLRRTLTRRQNRRLHRSASCLGFVPLVFVISGLPAVLSCQDVDIFEHKTTVCSTSKSNRQFCTVDITEVIKINSFSKEACFRLQNQGNVLKEIRVRWNELRLLCDKHATMFTRNTVLRVLDSKRCPHAGSCDDDKCAGVNTTAKIPELHQANQFPGVTFCVESCEGPGCGCFYMSSGCLFYRIYAQPLSDDVLEIFRCPRWKEEVLVELTVREGSKLTKNVTTALVPTIPQEMHGMRLKVKYSQCLLHQHSKRHSSAMGKTLRYGPNNSFQLCSAHLIGTRNCCSATCILTCDVHEEDLLGAENVSVRAIVPSLATAELLMTVNEEIDSTVKQITDSVCKVSNAEINGCYHCPQGAVAQITCISQDDDILATIACEDYTFSVPCTSKE
uniref:DUF5641 domain-containing protein n=1 Tax=Heligmosomoides polygyrus TaxID=6339 RepID=A0A183G4S3_HELPZ